MLPTSQIDEAITLDIKQNVIKILTSDYSLSGYIVDVLV